MHGHCTCSSKAASLIVCCYTHKLYTARVRTLIWIMLPFIHRKNTVWFSMTHTYMYNVKFQDFPGLENETVKFHDFPRFPRPIRTLTAHYCSKSGWGYSHPDTGKKTHNHMPLVIFNCSMTCYTVWLCNCNHTLL